MLGGNATLDVTIAGVTYGITAPQIIDACAVARAEVGDRVLGMFDYGLLELGGDLAIEDQDADGLADVVRSEIGFGSLLFLPPLPDPLAPRVSAKFVGTRSPCRWMSGRGLPIVPSGRAHATGEARCGTAGRSR